MTNENLHWWIIAILLFALFVLSNCADVTRGNQKLDPVPYQNTKEPEKPAKPAKRSLLRNIDELQESQ